MLNNFSIVSTRIIELMPFGLLCGLLFWWASVLLLQKRFVFASMLAVLAITTNLFCMSVVDWAKQLGKDSIIETQNFNVGEAKFLILNIFYHLQLGSAKQALFFFSVGIGSAISIGLLRKKLGISAKKTAQWVGGILVGFFVYMFFQFGLLFEKNTTTYNNLQNNFNNDFQVSKPLTDDMQVIVYIGESTSSMHMGLYGYFRDNTPMLAELDKYNPGFVKLNAAFAPHTHTAPSLLETLSLPSKPLNTPISIYEQERNALTTILNKAGVWTSWVSNQASTGTSSHISVVSSQANSLTYSDFYNASGSVFDHELFETHLNNEIGEFGNRVLFLHSYAGHAPYLQYLPKHYHNPVDAKLDRFSDIGIFGNEGTLKNKRKNIESYDSAIKYIDSNISTTMKLAEKSEKPTVIVYFSDHGEAVYSGDSHDSSRFKYEMSRVPFLVYFNRASQLKYKHIYERIRNIPNDEAIYLPQVSSLILELFGLIYNPQTGVPKFGLNWKNNDVFMLARETINGKAHIKLSDNKHISDEYKIIDPFIELWRLSRRFSNASEVCYNYASNLLDFIRGLDVTDCLKIDVIIDDKKINLVADKTEKTNIELSFILDLADKKKATIWLNVLNLREKNSCISLSRELKSLEMLSTNIFIDMKPNLDAADETVIECGQYLNQIANVKTGFTLPKELIEQCDDPLRTQCMRIEKYIQDMVELNIFSAISFDLSSLKMIKNIKNAHQLEWNVTMDQAIPLDEIELDMIGIKLFAVTQDLNTLY